MVEASPCGEQIRFTSSGTEGTFAALRIARAYTGREKVIKFEGGWHGAHDYAQLSTSAAPADYPKPIVDSAGIPGAASDTVLVAPFNDSEVVSCLIAAHAGDIAAIIVEPLQRAIPSDPGFLQTMRDECTKHGILLVFDEVVTSFRLAWGGAQERYGVVPDLAVYGKTISGGYPLAAVCGSADIMSCADPRRRGEPQFAFVSGTVNGNPVGASAGLATLSELVKDGAYDRLEATSASLREGMESQARKFDLPFQMLGQGPVLQPIFTDEKIRNHTDTLKGDAERARRFGIELLHRDIFNTPGGKLYISLAHTADDVERTLEATAEAFKAILEPAIVS